MAEKAEGAKDIAKIFEEGSEIDGSLRLGVRDALIMHKKLGFPIVVWEDDQIVWVPPEAIEIPPEE